MNRSLDMLKSWNGGCHLIENGAGVPTAANDPVGVTSGRGEGDRRSGRFLDIARESRQIKLPPRDTPRDPHNRSNRCGLCRDALPRPCAPVTLQIVGLFPPPHPVYDRVAAVVLTGMGSDGFEGTSGGHGRHSGRLDRSAVATSFFVESGTGTRTSWKLAATGGTGTRTSWKLAATGGTGTRTSWKLAATGGHGDTDKLETRRHGGSTCRAEQDCFRPLSTANGPRRMAKGECVRRVIPRSDSRHVSETPPVLVARRGCRHHP